MEHLSLNGRDVYIVERHNEVLPAWIEARQAHGAALPLITFDFHTDLQLAFASYASVNSEKTGDYAEMQELSDERLSVVDIADVASVQSAIEDLRHDEHIDCAHKLGLISDAYVLLGRQHQGLAQPFARLFNFIPCYPGCNLDVHTDDCEPRKADLVIDDSVLGPRVAQIEEHINLRSDPYILDIDLDVFSTRAAISPPASDSFLGLIRHAKIVTVARERGCTEYTEGGCCLEPGLTVEYLEERLMSHIESA